MRISLKVRHKTKGRNRQCNRCGRNSNFNGYNSDYIIIKYLTDTMNMLVDLVITTLIIVAVVALLIVLAVVYIKATGIHIVI